MGNLATTPVQAGFGPGHGLARPGGRCYSATAARMGAGRLRGKVPCMARNLVALGLWRKALVASVRHEGADLSARQMALLLTVYLCDPPHTVRGLAEALNISKPAVTRALDRLSLLGYIKRKRDAEDQRNVLVQRTVAGSVYLSEFADLVIAAGAVAPADMEQLREKEAMALAAKAEFEQRRRTAPPAP